MVAQRESRARSRDGRLARQRTRAGDHEARRTERGGRSAVHADLHGRQRRPRDRVRGRPGHGVQPERAGQPQLCEVRADADAGAVLQPGSLRPDHPRVRAFRTVQSAGPPPHDHARLPLHGPRHALEGKRGVPSGAVQGRRHDQGHDPGLRPPRPRPPHPGDEGPRGVQRSLRPAHGPQSRFRRTRRPQLRRERPACAGGRPGSIRAPAENDLAAPVGRHPQVRLRREAFRGRRGRQPFPGGKPPRRRNRGRGQGRRVRMRRTSNAANSPSAA